LAAARKKQIKFPAAAIGNEYEKGIGANILTNLKRPHARAFSIYPSPGQERT
jgi:hypothetical protein